MSKQQGEIGLDTIMHIVVVCIALLIGIVLFSGVNDAMDKTLEKNNCNGLNATSSVICISMNEARDNSNLVISLLPVVVIISIIGLLVIVKVPSLIDHDNDPSTPKKKVKLQLYKMILLKMKLAKEVKKNG